VPSPVCLIVNPAAGGGRAGKVAAATERALGEHGLTVRRVDTRDLDHARELAAEAAHAGETVVALGGDGTVGALADVLRAIPGAVLGVLPGGRGNDLARVLGIAEDPVQACVTIARGRVRSIDLGLVADAGADGAGRAFVGIASAGFDSEANRIANEAPAWLGGFVYAYGALRALVSWKPARFEIELDPPGARHVFSGYSIALANSKAYGGGMLLAPDALLDDGLLEVIASERVSKLSFLRSLPRVFKGTHVQLPSVRVFRAAAVTITADRPFTMYADGDPIGELPLRLHALPGAVDMLVAGEDAPDSPFSVPSPTSSSSAAAANPPSPARSSGPAGSGG
jgi:YegS/Rv2252/BmrU family lipid kinase